MTRECISAEADPGFVGLECFSHKQTYAKYEYKIRYRNAYLFRKRKIWQKFKKCKS